MDVYVNKDDALALIRDYDAQLDKATALAASFAEVAEEERQRNELLVETIEYTAHELIALLRDLEWAGARPGDTDGYCPWCARHVTDGHTPDCRLAQLKARHGGQPR